MKNRHLLLRTGVLMLGLAGGLSSTAVHAQPAEPQGQMQQVQRQQQMLQWLQNMSPQQLQQMLQRVQAMQPAQRQQIQQFLRGMTPEQREQLQQQMQPMLQNLNVEQRQLIEGLVNTPEQQRESWIRQVMAASGFSAVELQDTILSFIRAQERARIPLRKAASTLSESLINPAITNEQLKTSWAGFRDLVAKDQARYNTELAALDEKIKFSTQPRLEMLLGVIGVVGQETASIGGVGAVFPDSGFGSSLMTAPAGN